MVCNFPFSSQQVLCGYITNLALHKLLVTFMALLWSKWLSHKIFHCSFFFNCFYCEIPLWRVLGNISHSYGIDFLNLMIGLYLRYNIVYEQSGKLVKKTEPKLPLRRCLIPFLCSRIQGESLIIFKFISQIEHMEMTPEKFQFGLFSNSFFNIIILKLSEI